MKKHKKLIKILSIFGVILMLMSVIVVPFGASAWDSSQIKVNGVLYGQYDFNIANVIGKSTISFYGNRGGSFEYDLSYVSSSSTVVSYSCYEPFRYSKYNNTFTNCIGYPDYAVDKDTLKNTYNTFLNSSVYDFADETKFVVYGSTYDFGVSLDNMYYFDMSYYDTKCGYFYAPLIVSGSLELGYLHQGNFYPLFDTNDYVNVIPNPYNVVNMFYGLTDFEFFARDTDETHVYLMCFVYPVYTEVDHTSVYFDVYRSTYTTGNNDIKPLLNDFLDIGRAQGQSSSLGENILGTTLNGPIDALNEFILFSVGDVNVTLGGVVGCVIALTLFIIFLKMFAGG